MALNKWGGLNKWGDIAQPPIGLISIDSTITTATTARVNYSYNDTDETGFKYRLDNGSPIDIGTTNPFTIYGLDAETEYSVELLAYNASGDGNYQSPTVFNTQEANVTPTTINTISASVAMRISHPVYGKVNGITPF